MTDPLPFSDGSFDAVVANVSVHMFPWDVTQFVFEEVRRVVHEDGVFLFHVNAREDRPLRARRRKVVRELEPNYVLEDSGQAVRFLSDRDLESLLGGWHVALELVKITDEATGEPFKVVWRGVARGPPTVPPG